jgi:LPS export ABC transporter protein LptC
VASWHRRARLVVGIFLVGFATVIFFAIRERRTPAATKGVDISDPKAVVESTKGVHTRTKLDRPDFTLEYNRLLSYADGSSRFIDIKATVPQRAGRTFEITASEARVGANESNIEITGNVRMTASDGLSLRTDRATYDQNEGIVRIPGKVEFTRERMSGSGVGATYDRNRDVLWLLDQAHIVVKPDERGQGASEITAGAAGLARRDKYARFERSVKVLRDGRVMEADGAVAYLSDDEKRIEMVEMRGSSRVSGGGGGAGSLEAMTARDINLYYAPDGQALTRATLAGDSAIQLIAAPGQSGRRLAADSIDTMFAPDGTTVTSVSARDRVELTLPADAQAPSRQIRADALEGQGAPPDGIKSARFTGNVEFRETRAATKTAAALGRIACARTLDAALKPGFSAIDEAKFDGDVRFRDGDLTAQAPTCDVRSRDGDLTAQAPAANYQVAKSIVLLVSDPKQPAAPATVVDAQTSIQATTIDLTLQGRSLKAKGDVRSVLQPSKPGVKPAAGKDAPKRPGMLKNDQPVYVTGHELAYDGTNRLAVYTGEARLWQGQTAVQAATLSLDEQKGNLLATGAVRSTLQMEQTNEKTKTKERVTSIASADELLYEDNLRRATYTTKAHVTGPQGDLTADKVELYLLEGGSELDRAEAYGSVKVKDKDRTATGARMTYHAKDERYDMSGTPVQVVEQTATGCRETRGRTLTFHKSVDTIRVDGKEIRAEAKTGGKCPEP